MKTLLLLPAIHASLAGASVPAGPSNQTGAPSGRPAALHLPVEGKLPSLKGATAWINSPPLAAPDLRGKVVLVQFWTYSCINWLRTLPYVRAWSEKYKDQGLVVIGVHTPEFGFEKNIENVRRAVSEMTIRYPIAVDSDRLIWWAFDNNSWPAFYFVDARGQIRHHRFGEGEYVKAERVIQQLLAEAGKGDGRSELVFVDGVGAEGAPDWENLRSPEIYLGYARTENFASPGRLTLNRSRMYVAPDRLKLNAWALVGDWTVNEEAVALNKGNGRIVCRFHARDLHLVMGPVEHGVPVRFRVLIDGQPPGSAHGTDVDSEGNGTITGQRLYQLLRQPTPIGERRFEIEFLDAGAEAFSFTFG